DRVCPRETSGTETRQSRSPERAQPAHPLVESPPPWPACAPQPPVLSRVVQGGCQARCGVWTWGGDRGVGASRRVGVGGDERNLYRRGLRTPPPPTWGGDRGGGSMNKKIIVMMSVSLDGFIEGPKRELDWHCVDDELHSHFNAELRKMSAFLNGRVMYELMAAFWPTADADPASTPPMAEFAAIWREMPKIVFSRTLQQAGWNTTVVREVIPHETGRLQAHPGGDMARGGADLPAPFARHNLVDEYRIYVHPVVIGGGKPLFALSEGRQELRLAETRTF